MPPVREHTGSEARPVPHRHHDVPPQSPRSGELHPRTATDLGKPCRERRHEKQPCLPYRINETSSSRRSASPTEHDPPTPAGLTRGGYPERHGSRPVNIGRESRCRSCAHTSRSVTPLSPQRDRAGTVTAGLSAWHGPAPTGGGDATCEEASVRSEPSVSVRRAIPVDQHRTARDRAFRAGCPSDRPSMSATRRAPRMAGDLHPVRASARPCT